MDYAVAVRRDAAAIFDLCGQNHDLEIPACPGWTASDLRTHLIETFAGELPGFGDPTDENLSARLDTALDQNPAEAKAVAHECAIHRWDIATAAGETFQIEPALACDGLEDFFRSAWPFLLDYLKRPAGSGERIGLHATDCDVRWVVNLDEQPRVQREAAPTHVRVAGTASDLFLWVWGRSDPPQVDGDVAVLEMIRNPRGRYLSPGF